MFGIVCTGSYECACSLSSKVEIFLDVGMQLLDERLSYDVHSDQWVSDFEVGICVTISCDKAYDFRRLNGSI